MTIFVHVLVAAAATLSLASGTSLILNEANVPLELGAPLQLDCGVEGHYHHCFWETKDGRVFQVEDVHAGIHVGLRAPHNLTHNQCGIVVEKSSPEDAGEWACRVLLNEAALKGVIRVGQECTPPFEAVGTGCYYFSELIIDSWEDARTFCHSLATGADLAVLDDCHQFQLVWSHILVNYDPTPHWIGATDDNLDQQFLWVDGTSVTLGTPFWLYGQPSGEKCVFMTSPYGYYDDGDCNKEYHFLCQQL